MEALLGFAIALVVGVTGMGGGILAAPLLMLVLGLPPAQAVGASLLFVTLTKAAAAVLYWHRGQIDWPAYARLLAGGVPGVLLGAFFLRKMSSHAKLQPVVLALIGAVIAVMAVVTVWRTLSRPAAPGRRYCPRALSWAAFPIGLEVGFSSAGAGALTSLSLFEFTRLAPASVVGTDLMFGLSIAAVGGGLHLASGPVDLRLLAQLTSGGIAGALCGASLAGRMPARALRFALSAIMAVLGQQLLWRGIAALSR